MAGVAGGPLAPGLVAALHAETGGNPFFLEEITRHLVETRGRAELESTLTAPTSFDLPDGVRDVVDRRLRRLDPDVVTTLQVAAIVGRELRRAPARPRRRTGRSPTSSAPSTTRRAPGSSSADPDVPGRYSFAHALIRQTIDTTLGAARTAELHAAVADAIETGGIVRGDAAVLARHFGHAEALLGPDKAIEYAIRAGHEAIADLAFEDAAAFFADARRRYETTVAPDPAPPPRPPARPRGGAGHGRRARRRRDRPRRRSTTRARSVTPSGSARAVAIFVEPMHGVDAFPSEVVALFDEARTTIGDDHLALRARLLAFEAFKYGAFQLRGRDGHALGGRGGDRGPRLRRPDHALRRAVGAGGDPRGHRRRPGPPRDRQRAGRDRRAHRRHVPPRSGSASSPACSSSWASPTRSTARSRRSSASAPPSAGSRPRSTPRSGARPRPGSRAGSPMPASTATSSAPSPAPTAARRACT